MENILRTTIPNDMDKNSLKIGKNSKKLEY